MPLTSQFWNQLLGSHRERRLRFALAANTRTKFVFLRPPVSLSEEEPVFVLIRLKMILR